MYQPPEPSGPLIKVHVHSLTEAGTFLQNLGRSLAGEVHAVRTAAVDGLGAIPQSDLFQAYAFCWGRWSNVLDDTHKAVTGMGKAVHRGGQTYKDNDDHAGGHK